MVARSLLALILLASTTSRAGGVIDAPPSKQQQNKSRVFTADAVKKKGLELKKLVDVDIDGDGRKENIGAASGKNGIQLVVVGEDKDGAVVTAVLPPAGGRELARFEAMALAPPSTSTELVLEVYDENPDEKVKRVRAYGSKDGKIVELFTSVLHRSKKAEERDEWERDKSIVTYGDARGGWYFDDLEEDGVTEILVRRRPQILRFKRDDGSDVKVLTGVREQVWRFDTDAGTYKDTGERLNDFLPSREIVAVRASSAWIDPAELKELKAAALQDALMKGGGEKGGERAMGGELELGLEDLEAPAAAGSPGKAKTKAGKAKNDDEAPAKTKAKAKAASTRKAAAEEEAEPEVTIDRVPYMKRAADKDLSTAWIEDDAKGDGKGEWLEFELDEAAPVHMVRIVSGCVDTKESFRDHNVPESFSLSLDGGSEAVIDRRQPTKFDSPAVAFADDLVKLKDRPWAKTTLVFFDGKAEAKKVKLTLDRAVKQGKGNHTCISEVSIH
jgi:hypothetical protein